MVQRSRAYVKQSQQHRDASGALFPERAAPQVVPYNLKATYGPLLDSVEQAFNKKNPLFVLGIYYPLAYWKGDKDRPAFRSFDEGRQKQVVILIRTLFLKRFESSARAFEGSCWRLLQKLLAWVTVMPNPTTTGAGWSAGNTRTPNLSATCTTTSRNLAGRGGRRSGRGIPDRGSARTPSSNSIRSIRRGRDPGRLPRRPEPTRRFSAIWWPRSSRSGTTSSRR